MLHHHSTHFLKFYYCMANVNTAALVLSLHSFNLHSLCLRKAVMTSICPWHKFAFALGVNVIYLRHYNKTAVALPASP